MNEPHYKRVCRLKEEAGALARTSTGPDQLLYLSEYRFWSRMEKMYVEMTDYVQKLKKRDKYVTNFFVEES